MKIEGSLRLTLRDGSIWEVPVWPIAHSRAKHYADEFDGDIQKSLDQDTLPLFKDCPDEVYEWMADNMDWEELSPYKQKICDSPPLTTWDFEIAWSKGDRKIFGFKVTE